ncbi:MAG: Mov34/MPN/PAD-1 family protein [Candidatus Binatia bacterium]
MIVTISQATLDALHTHARDCYPDECCGMIVERSGREEAVRVTNIQNERHAQDPEQFPRTAATAYQMGPEHVPILIAAERGELVLRAFYHSHPDHDAYFSAEDRKQAMGGWDEPNYPAAGQIVISVRERVVRATKAFAWNEAARDFVETALVVR